MITFYDDFSVIKHKKKCEDNAICLCCGKNLLNKKGFFVNEPSKAYWLCLKCGKKNNALEITPEDYWLLALLIQDLQIRLRRHKK